MDPVIVIEDLHYAYPPSTAGEEPSCVLSGVSLSLAQGECLALLGPTGAGKSTHCLTLNGIIPHLIGGSFRGTVSVMGRDTREGDAGELSQRVGLVLQDPESQLFNMTVEDEVAFGPESLALRSDEIEARVAEALGITGIADLRKRSPLELSGGQKQRVALAAVLAMRPQILVLDEPTASLDPVGKRSLLEAVGRLRAQGGVSILWVTQDVDQLPLMADRVAVLYQGRIAQQGTVRDIFARGDDLRRIGLALPQMRELASRFNRVWASRLAWHTVPEAAQDLKERLRG